MKVFHLSFETLYLCIHIQTIHRGCEPKPHRNVISVSLFFYGLFLRLRI